LRDGHRLEFVRVVEAGAQPRLVAAFVDGVDGATRNVTHEQFDRVGANVDDSASHGSHIAETIKTSAPTLPKSKPGALRA
jgi:hypothetical protein